MEMKIEARYVGDIKEKKIDSINLRSRQSKSKPSKVYHSNHEEIKTVCRCKNVILASILFYLLYAGGLIITNNVAQIIIAAVNFEIMVCIGLEWLDKIVIRILSK